MLVAPLNDGGISQHQMDQMKMMLKEIPEAVTFYGRIFEADVHQALSGHCALSVRALSEGSAFEPQDAIVIAKSDTVDEFDTCSLSIQMLTRGPYHKPRSGKLESIDSFYLPKISVNVGQKVIQSAVVEWSNQYCLLLFEVTMSKTHPMNASGIIYLLSKLGLLKYLVQHVRSLRDLDTNSLCRRLLRFPVRCPRQLHLRPGIGHG